VQGPGALDFLQKLCANDIDKPIGSVIYTQMLNARGGIECDFTVSRLANDRFMIVTGTAFGTHDMTHLRRYMPLDGTVFVNDITSARTCFGLWGPYARDLLQSITRDDVSNEAFPYMTAKQITIGNIPTLALRVTYVGELGWEFYAPSEYGEQLWDTLWNAGKEFGMVAGGYKAIESLRLEKGYRYWSADITPDYTPYEAGLGFAVALNKSADFMGKQALIKQVQSSLEANRFDIVAKSLVGLHQVDMGIRSTRVSRTHIYPSNSRNRAPESVWNVLELRFRLRFRKSLCTIQRVKRSRRKDEVAVTLKVTVTFNVKSWHDYNYQSHHLRLWKCFNRMESETCVSPLLP
jgi:glycine cleavage system aminomethyltransferase T